MADRRAGGGGGGGGDDEQRTVAGDDDEQRTVAGDDDDGDRKHVLVVAIVGCNCHAIVLRAANLGSFCLVRRGKTS